MSFEIREKPEMVERALLVGLGMPGESRRERQALLAELQDLVQNLGIGIVGSLLEYTREIQAKYLCGIGKAMEIQQRAIELDADCVIFDNLLSPSQQREWEKLLNVTVIDREEVILDIFAKRARTREAVMQVDLARMQYALPRMAGMWKHLDRQRGGSGGGKGGGAAARGEGEKQIEVDRRLARDRIEAIRSELEIVRRQRGTQRKERTRQGIPAAAIVGYTNAGKSTILRTLTGAEVLVENRMFATLDPTSRQLYLPSQRPAVLIDTVGFIQDLPQDLAKAFKATLEELNDADLLLHVVDLSNPEFSNQIMAVQQILEELALDDLPQLVVFNKIDKTAPEIVENTRQLWPEAVFVSALELRSLHPMLERIDQALAELEPQQPAPLLAGSLSARVES